MQFALCDLQLPWDGAYKSLGRRSPLRDHTRDRTWHRHVISVLLYQLSYVYAHAIRARPIHWSRSPASNRQPPVYKTDARPLVLERHWRRWRDLNPRSQP